MNTLRATELSRRPRPARTSNWPTWLKAWMWVYLAFQLLSFAYGAAWDLGLFTR